MSSEDRITFYTDDDVDGPAIRWARNLGVAIVTSNEAGNTGEYDETHFSYAVNHDYVLVTGNIKDFEPLFYAYAVSGLDHPGIVFIRSEIRTSSGFIAEELQILFELGTREEMKNRIVRI
jgi:hypothetical protein